MKSREYWHNRFLQLEQSQNQLGIQCYEKIERQYRRAMRQLEAQINTWYGRLAQNNNVTMQDARRMLTGRELEEFKWDVKDYIHYGEENALSGEWMKQLENASARYHISRMEALKVQMQQNLEVMFGNQIDTIDTAMRDIYINGYYHTAYEIQKGAGVGWNFATLDNRSISKVINCPWAADGKNFSERIWQNRQKLVNELHTQLSQNIILGQDPQKAIDAIAHKMNTSKINAGRLIMTEKAFFSSAAQKDCFKELGVEMFEVVATLDSHTSDICQEMDGKVFPMTQWEVGVTAPPFHVFCRSTTVPAFEDEFDSIGERTARDEEDGKTYHVPANMTYKEWKERFNDGGDKSGLQESVPNGIIKHTPKVKAIDDCTTVKEVEDLFKVQEDWFNVQTIRGQTIRSIDGLSLQGTDLTCAKSIYKTHETLFSKYPQLKGKLNAVNSAPLSNNAYAECFFGLGHGGVTVNEKYFGDAVKLQQTYAKDLAAGYHPAGTDYTAIVMHELGHAIDDYLTYTEHMVGLANHWKPKIVSTYLRPKVMRSCGLKVGDIQKSVSVYATQNAQEWFAECFAEYMCSENPRPVAAEFGKQLEELLKGVN